MNLGTRILTSAGVVVMSAGALLFAQGGDANKVLADMRQALGGDKIAAVKTLTAVGKTMRAMGDQSIQTDYELAIERPDKYLTRQVAAKTPMGDVTVTAGFNGAGLIQDTEMPQMPAGGNMFVRVGGAGGALPGQTISPEEQAAADAKNVLAYKRDYARMTVALFGGSPEGYPLTFTYSGVAEAPDGKADVLAVTGEGDFSGKLFVDQKTHLPLMFSWMDKEPLKMSSNVSSGGPGAARNGGGGMTMVMGNQQTRASTPEEREKMMKDLQDRMKEAEAKRKMVEYRVYYGDFQQADGVNWPHRFQQSVNGDASSELTIEKYKLNPKIDPKKFEPKKLDSKKTETKK